MRAVALLIAPCFAMLSQSAIADVGSHCTAAEQTVWSCRAGAKIYSLCASADLDRARGYLQYRAGRINAIELRYPPITRHPSEVFAFSLLPHGASLRFRSGGYEYSVSEDLKGEPVIFVLGQGKSGSVQCSASTNSLTLNSSMELFANAGIGERPRN